MKTEKEYRTHQVLIKKGHRLFSYFEEMTQNAKNMYNTTNFYLRQVYTALKTTKPLQPLQNQVMDELIAHLPSMNDTQHLVYQKKLGREQLKPLEKQKEVKLNLFAMPTEKKAFLTYGFLDALFKDMNQADYRSLPAQSTQAIMKKVFSNWASFFEGKKAYDRDSSAFTGRPRIPGYSKATQKEVYFSNQDCVIKEDKYLKFPKTSIRLNLGKMAKTEGKLKEVRVLPTYGKYTVECVFEVTPCVVEPTETKRIMSIDPGIDNLATIVTNTGMNPVLIKGKHVKSINAYYNKQKGHYLGILRQGKDSKQGPFTSKRLNRIHETRHRKIKDIFHKASYHIVKLAEEQEVDTIVFGQNKGWKQEINIGRRNNQNFCHIPHLLLFEMIAYKAKQKGIKVVGMEESYTSQASFLDNDFIPTYHPTTTSTFVFSGKRKKRGLYVSKTGQAINADVNGAANILKKYVINVLKQKTFNPAAVCVVQPMPLNV